MSHRLSVGLSIVGNANWMGGVTYIELLAKALRSLPAAEQPVIKLIIRSRFLDAYELHRHFVHLFDGIVFIGSDDTRLGLYFQHPFRVVKDFMDVYKHIDFFYPSAQNVHPGKAASWFPDLQHLHLPHFFTEKDIRHRNERLQLIVDKAKIIVCSSDSVRNDLASRYPSVRTRTRVLHFHHLPRDEWFQMNPDRIISEYGIPHNYLIACNQFWAHKNHALLFQAMKILQDKGLLIPLVCTGGIQDYRNPHYYDTLMKTTREIGIDEQLYILGEIPRNKQIQLLRGAMALVQPSLFEGWSTVVEDARSLGKVMFLSDLEVHKEQAPKNAMFFDRHDPHALAELLAERFEHLSPGPDLDQEREAADRAQELVLSYARAFMSIALYAQELDDDSFAMTPGMPSDGNSSVTNMAYLKALHHVLNLREGAAPRHLMGLAEKLVERFPDQPEALSLCGELQLRGGAYRLAESTLSRLADCNEDANDLNNYSLALLMRGKPQEALQTMEKAFAIEKGNSVISANMLMMVKIYRKTGGNIKVTRLEQLGLEVATRKDWPKL